jgi:hypothetical protein
VQRTIEHATAGSLLQLSTAYFNLTAPLESALAGSTARVQLLTAALAAHGWAGATGVGRLLPRLYQHLEGRLLRRLCWRKGAQAVSLFEFCRADWQFHSKGLWCAASPPRPVGCRPRLSRVRGER